MLLLLACHDLPTTEDRCAESDTVVDAADSTAGFSAEEVWALLADGRVADWDATGEELVFEFSPDSGDILLEERSDGPDGPCPRTGTLLRVPIVADLVTEGFSAEIDGTLDAWALDDDQIELRLSDSTDVDVDADLQAEAEDLADQEEADLYGYVVAVDGNVTAGTLRLDAEVWWGGGDSGEDDDAGTVTLREGDWTTR